MCSLIGGEERREDRPGGGKGGGCEVVKICLVQHQITIRPREVAVPAVVSSTYTPGLHQGCLSAAANMDGFYVPFQQAAPV